MLFSRQLSSKDLSDLVAIVDKAKISYGRVPDVEMQQVYADMMYDAMANTSLSPEQVAQKAEWGFAAGPLLVGGTVYAADLSGRVLAIDPG